ncbi:MAG TPA: hypothetical protein VGD81_07580 [Opitutaceae bacterium]
MTTSVAPRLRRRRVWRWVLGGLAVSFGVLGICVLNAVTLTRDAAALRNTLVRTGDVRPELGIQVSAGPFLLGVVRGVLHFIPDVPTEAHQALEAVRSASVGVYQLKDPIGASVRSELLAAAEALMVRRGWTRAVGVRDGDDTVMVFAPADLSDDGPVRVCVAVCSHREVVVVEARVAPDLLAELVATHGAVLARR